MDDHKDIAQLIASGYIDGNDSKQRIAIAMTSGRNEILKDLSTAGIATIGAIITLLTISIQIDTQNPIVQTPTVLIIGATIIGIATILSFAFRHIQNEYLYEVLIVFTKERNKLLAAMRSYIREPNEDNSRKFADSLKHEKLASRSNILEFGDKYVGIFMFIGVVISLCGLFLQITV